MTPARALGEKLRQARAQRGLSLESIAQETKIGLGLLTSLERGDCSRWPTGVYSRAYVRSYSQSIGLDSKTIVEEFCDCFPTVAWPDGPPGPVQTADSNGPDPSRLLRPHRQQNPLDLTQYDLPEQPLRLTLDPMPRQPWRLLRSSVARRLAECAAGILDAAAASLFGMDFWMALSAASLAVQARHLP